MKVKEMQVSLVERDKVKDFIEVNHYSGNINGCIADYCFSLTHKGAMIGAMFYGRMAMAGQWKRFGEKEEDVIELRRLCCIDETPKNTESYFISKTLKWLKRNTDIKIIVSYADLEHGHTGVIYKASNFQLEGFRKGAKVIVSNGKTYHDKTIRTKYKGELKPFAKRLKADLESGEAYYKTTKGKFCYIYKLK